MGFNYYNSGKCEICAREAAKQSQARLMLDVAAAVAILLAGAFLAIVTRDIPIVSAMFLFTGALLSVIYMRTHDSARGMREQIEEMEDGRG